MKSEADLLGLQALKDAFVVGLVVAKTYSTSLVLSDLFDVVYNRLPLGVRRNFWLWFETEKNCDNSISYFNKLVNGLVADQLTDRGDHRRSSNRTGAPRHSSPQCFYCKSDRPKPRLAQECPRLAAVVCYNCDSKGHLKKHCPNKDAFKYSCVRTKDKRQVGGVRQQPSQGV